MSVAERVVQIVANVLNLAADSIRLEASLKDDLGATSLERYTILMELEDAYALDLDDVPEEDLEEKLHTVADIMTFLAAQGVVETGEDES
jgi:acyl carrier protein